MSNNPLDDDVATGETVVAILKTDLGPTRIIDGAESPAPKPDVPNRYEITLTIKDVWMNQTHTYEVTP